MQSALIVICIIFCAATYFDALRYDCRFFCENHIDFVCKICYSKKKALVTELKFNPAEIYCDEYICG